MAEDTWELQKKQMFDSLYSLDDDLDCHDDPGHDASVEALRGKTLGDPTHPTSSSKRNLALTRSASTVVPSTSAASNSSRHAEGVPRPRRQTPRELLDTIGAVKGTPIPSLPKRHTLPETEASDRLPLSVSISSAIPRARGKRKRDAEIKLVPKNQRVFQNLHFYFFPPDDINPSRRQRIIKALEFGATWQKEWNDTITHVVMDDTMHFSHLLNQLKKHGSIESDDLPSNVIVVSQGYPADCITFRYMIDTTRAQYVPNGYTPAARTAGAVHVGEDMQQEQQQQQPEETTNLSQSSHVSLQLKPPGKAVIARELMTSNEATPSVPSATARSGDNSDGDENFVSASDELDAAIRETKETEHLALESEHEDDEDSPAQVTDPGGHVESDKATKSDWQSRFQCMTKHEGNNSVGPNARTIALLQDMADYYAQTRDEWRPKAYRSAIARLRQHPVQVRTKEEAMKLHGIGESIAEKIEEIVVSNRLRKLDYAQLDSRQRILQTFMKIYGVGYNIAERWLSAGYRTLDDIKRKAALTPNQRIGLDHYDDFNARIPRSEVEQHARIVKTALRGLDTAYQVYTMGSYRRGAETCGDIDLIVTKPGAHVAEIRDMVLERLVPLLTHSKFLVAALAATAAADGTKWHGASCLPGAHIWRRIDLLLVPEDELGAALIYFTGNDIFNRSLRLLASKKGMRLNQRGLYKDALRGQGRAKLSEGVLVEGKSERRIFKALGVPWRPPHHRIC